MACSGSHCSNHGTGTTTCSGHRASCSTNRTLSVSGEFASTSGRILASDVNNLRESIRAEVARYNLHRSFTNISQRQGSGYTAGATLIDNSHINDFELMAQQVNNVNEPVGTNYAVLTDPADFNTAANQYQAGAPISVTHWTTIRDKYNTMRTDCICNSDCSCNLVCACHNDCGCNYSDERLKENIEFIEVKNGLNIYSWNYIWNSAKRYTGVMAQEIIKSKYASAVKTDKNGYYMVDYNQLPV
jgi:hypothetical protein